MKSKTIQTSRLLLRAIRSQDAERIVELRNNEEVYKFFKNPHKITVEGHLRWYEDRYKQDETRYDFVILLPENPEEVIGTCGISELDIDKKSMEVSYLLDDKFQGKGYAAEAVTALIHMAKSKWNIAEVHAVIHKENKQSIHFGEKLGFELYDSEEPFFWYKITLD